MSDQQQQAELKALIDAAPGLFQANVSRPFLELAVGEGVH